MFIESRGGRWLDRGYLGQGSILHVGEELRHGGDVVGIAGGDGTSPRKVINIAQRDQARCGWIVGAGSVLRIDVNFPRNAGAL